MVKLRALALFMGAGLLSTTAAWGAATTVREPAFGLPHIFADTDLELARENGREIAKDRLVQMILLARTGRGTIRQPFGALDPTTLDDDIEARRTGYTSSELNNMYAKLPQRERDTILEACRGVNDTIDAIYAGSLPEPLEVNILRDLLGLDFDLFGNATDISDGVDPFYAPPGGAWPNAGFQFTPEMVMAISVLEVRNFGLGGFDEANLLAELQALIAKHGLSAGTEIWDDRSYLNDPLAPVSVPDPTTPGYGGPLAKATDRTKSIEIASRFPRYDYAAMSREIAAAKAARAEFASRLGAWPMMGSYAWVIAGNKSATGYPWLGGFPQTGIQTPSLMHFVENRSAEGTSNRIRGIGMEFAGAPLVLIGQTDTVAYTSTTAQLRVIDTFLETVINEDAETLSYNDEGVTALLNRREELFQGTLGAQQRRNTFWRSHDRGGNNGSRPIARFIGDASGTSESGTVNTLVDNQAAFDASYVGGYVAIVDRFRATTTVGTGQIREIAAVPNATTLQVGSNFTTAPDNSFMYVAVKAGNDILGVAIDSPTWMEESTTALGFGLMQRAESVLDIRANTRLMPSTHNFPSADNLAFNGIGTASGNGNIMFATSGFSRKGRPDPRLPMDGTSPSNPLIVSSGSVASATATTLVATGAPFTGDNYAPPALNFRYDNPTQQGSEFIVSITTGAGAKQTRRIASNTASDLTIEFEWGVIPSPGDTFEVYEIVAIPEAINPTEGYLANWNNKSATADEGDDFGRQFRNIFLLEALDAENAWDRDKQRQLNKDVAGLDGRGDFGRYLIPRLRQALNAVGTGGDPALNTVVTALEAHQAAPFLGRYFIDPVTATTTEGELAFLNSLINRLAIDIYGDEYAGAVSVPTGGKALNLVQHAIDSKAADVPGSYAQSYSGDYFETVPAGIDHFSCYKARRTPGTPAFTQATVALEDTFENGMGEAKRARGLCAPADLNGSGVLDSVSHLIVYKLRNELPPLRLADASVTDRFGTKTLRMIVKADRLLVPSGKALGGAASPPPAGLDHYKCYKARLARSEFTETQVTVTDQFETNRVYDLRRGMHFCAPVNKNGEGIIQPGAFLMCYQARVPTGDPAVTKVENLIHVNNQLGANQQLDTIREEQVCVPATYNVAGLEGWEYTVRDSLAAQVAAGGIPADGVRPNSTYNHPLSALFPGPPPTGLQFPPTPQGNRGTYEQIVDVGPVINGEFIFPLGQSGHIEGTIGGVTAIDPNFTTLHPLWRDWRFAPMLHIGEDLEAGNADADADGIFDGFERWHYGNTAQAAASDTDLDGSTLLQEFTNGSDPNDSDTDDDAALDGADAEPQDRLVQ